MIRGVNLGAGEGSGNESGNILRAGVDEIGIRERVLLLPGLAAETCVSNAFESNSAIFETIGAGGKRVV